MTVIRNRGGVSDDLKQHHYQSHTEVHDQIITIQGQTSLKNAFHVFCMFSTKSLRSNYSKDNIPFSVDHGKIMATVTYPSSLYPQVCTQIFL